MKGYICDWCRGTGTSQYNQYQQTEPPKGWAKIQGEDVCSKCIANARDHCRRGN